MIDFVINCFSFACNLRELFVFLFFSSVVSLEDALNMVSNRSKFYICSHLIFRILSNIVYLVCATVSTLVAPYELFLHMLFVVFL